MPTIVQIQGNFQWLVYRRDETHRWIGVCDPLNLSIEADSLEELHSLIHEGMDLLMHDLLEDNELEQYMKQRGWTVSGLPAAAKPEEVRFNLPPIDWRFVSAQDIHGPERRAH